MRRAASIASIVWLAMCCARVVHATSLEVYGRLPLLEDVALSPDGTRLAFVKTVGDDRVIATYSLADRKIVDGLRVGQQKLRRMEWLS